MLEENEIERPETLSDGSQYFKKEIAKTKI